MTEGRVVVGPDVVGGNAIRTVRQSTQADDEGSPVTKDTQVVVIGDPTTAARLLAVDATGRIVSVTHPQIPIPSPTRSAPGPARILFVEDGRAVVPGLWNDGLGTIARDCDIMFNGRPTLRLDTGGQTGTLTSLTVPSQPTGTAVGSGGTLSAGTYYYKITAVDTVGHETSASTERSVATGATDSVTLSWGAITGAASYNVYRGTVSGTNNLLINVVGTSYLDTGSATIGSTPPGSNGTANPGRSAAVSGVVAKRRIHDGYRGKFGMEMWFRFTGINNTSNTFLSMSVYNRDGTNAHHGRVWLDVGGNNLPMKAQILDGTASTPIAFPVYRTAATSVLQNGGGTHTYDVPTGRLDRAGGWHWVKLVVDFVTKKYVSVQLDGEALVDLSAYDLDVAATAGFAGEHFSVEYCGSTSTRPRYVNVTNIIGTIEP